MRHPGRRLEATVVRGETGAGRRPGRRMEATVVRGNRPREAPREALGGHRCNGEPAHGERPGRPPAARFATTKQTIQASRWAGLDIKPATPEFKGFGVITLEHSWRMQSSMHQQQALSSEGLRAMRA